MAKTKPPATAGDDSTSLLVMYVQSMLPVVALTAETLPSSAPTKTSPPTYATGAFTERFSGSDHFRASVEALLLLMTCLP